MSDNYFLNLNFARKYMEYIYIYISAVLQHNRYKIIEPRMSKVTLSQINIQVVHYMTDPCI